MMTMSTGNGGLHPYGELDCERLDVGCSSFQKWNEEKKVLIAWLICIAIFHTVASPWMEAVLIVVPAGEG
jgi:hypothetical protein